MAEYTKSEFERMQREAAERVRRMQERARIPPATHDRPPMPDFVRPLHTEHAPPGPLQAPTSKPDAPRGKNGRFDLMQMLNLKNLPMDSDRALILLLIVILWSEDCDEILLLALLYLML